MAPDESIKRCELNPRFGSELFKTEDTDRRVSVTGHGYDCDWYDSREGTYRLVNANADPNPCFFRFRSHALNELVLSERLGQRRYFVRLCDKVGCLGQKYHPRSGLRSIRDDLRDSLQVLTEHSLCAKLACSSYSLGE